MSQNVEKVVIKEDFELLFRVIFNKQRVFSSSKEKNKF